MASIISGIPAKPKVDSELAKVPRIGEILTAQKVITKEQSDSVINEITRKRKNGEKPGFFGEESVKMKREDGTPLVTEEQLNAGLKAQASQRAIAAEKDLAAILKGNELFNPLYANPHWGNGPKENPVNNALKNPTQLDAATAAANTAELLVVLANKSPELAKKQELIDAVSSSANLTLNISGDKNAQPLSGNELAIMQKGLKLSSTIGLASAREVNSYIVNRFSEITAGMVVGKASPAATKAAEVKTQAQRASSVPQYNLHVIDKTNFRQHLPDYKPVLELYVNMLESIGSTALDSSKKAYGILGKGQDGKTIWDETQLSKYLTENLTDKFENKGHTEFRMLNSNNKLIGVASGDLNNPIWTQQIQTAKDKGGNYFRLLNVVIEKESRGKGVGTQMLRLVNNDLVEKRNVKHLEGPVSNEAKAKGLADFYEKTLKSFGFSNGADKDIYNITPQAVQSIFTIPNPRKIEPVKQASQSLQASASFASGLNKSGIVPSL